jgi:hypothetical protein
VAVLLGLWLLSCGLAVGVHLVLLRMQWLFRSPLGGQIGIDVAFVLGLLWALWADWHYGVLLAALATSVSTVL